jgi:hypothetical protein
MHVGPFHAFRRSVLGQHHVAHLLRFLINFPIFTEQDIMGIICLDYEVDYASLRLRVEFELQTDSIVLPQWLEFFEVGIYYVFPNIVDFAIRKDTGHCTAMLVRHPDLPIRIGLLRGALY